MTSTFPDSPHRRRRRRSLLLFAATLLGGFVAIAGAISSYRKVESFQPVGFVAEPRSGHWLVTQVTGPGITLAPGDRVLLVGGREAGQIGDLAAILRQRASTDLVVLRGESILPAIHYQRPPVAIDASYLILALIGAGYLVIGFYTLLQDQRRAAILFYLWCLTSALVYVASPTDFMSPLDRLVDSLETLGRILLAPLTLHLFLVFPRRLERARAFVPFLYLPAACLVLAELDAIVFGGRLVWGGNLSYAIGALQQLELYHLVALALAAVAVLGWRLWRRAHPEPVRQATWIALGMAGGYLPFLALYLLPRTFGSEPGPMQSALSVLPLALVPVTFAYAILRYRLWDIGAVVRSSLALTLTILVGVLGFSLVNLMVSRVVPDTLQGARTMLTFVSGLVIAGMMIPTRRNLNRSLERIQYPRTYRQRRSLADFGRDLLRERDLHRLSEMLLGQLEGTFDLERSNLLLLGADGFTALRPESEMPSRLAADAFSDVFWAQDVKALTGVEMTVDETSPEQHLVGTGYRYALPLRVRETRLGAVVLGYRVGSVPLSSADLDLIRSLLNQVSLAVENARLLDQVKVQLDEVVRLQNYTQEILESSPAGIVVLDPRGDIETANAAFAELVGVAETELAGRPLADVLPVESLPLPGHGVREISLGGDGDERRYLQVSVALLEDDPEQVRRVVVAADVTDRVAMERALQEKERLAALGMLAAGVAHEVNTPLTGISSYAQMLLASTPEDDPRRAVLEKMERQTFRASKIVGNLLDISRDRPLERRPVELSRVVDEALELVGERIRLGNAVLIWEPPASPVATTGNDTELQQVVTNLVANAVDAMAPAGGDLTIALSVDGDWARLSVLDCGPGIPASELGRIFEPFYSTKVAQGGTGLGLSISRTIVRRHGGEIRVVSQPGQGSRFLVELPLAAERGAGGEEE